MANILQHSASGAVPDLVTDCIVLQRGDGASELWEHCRCQQYQLPEGYQPCTQAQILSIHLLPLTHVLYLRLSLARSFVR